MPGKMFTPELFRPDVHYFVIPHPLRLFRETSVQNERSILPSV
jgi:hypothetical protein